MKKKQQIDTQVYDHKNIETKWQKKWSKAKVGCAKENPKKPKFFGLIEFPYPSGDGLHVGHIRSNTAMDIIARKRRREGFEVLYPIGWDAFGLPTENYAIKTGIQPSIVTKNNTDIFRRQLKSLGFSFDWSREIDTTNPKYYKWTQWIFLQFLKKGLAYKKKMTINWCPKDLTGLANEEVVDGCCERCGTKVEKKEKEQWMLAITKYAERLDKDLDDTEFLEKIKIQQRNWIGKSEGAMIKFQLQNTNLSSTNQRQSDHKNTNEEIEVFTTRPDTLFGVTYVVLAPEHKMVSDILPTLKNSKDVEQYINRVKKETELERTDDTKEKSGIKLEGVFAINPANKEKVPVFIADYVLADYGTGAVMAVPAHDTRDWDFAKKYNLKIKTVIEPLVNRYDGTDAIRPELPFSERRAAVCIIKHWSEDKYLMSFYKKNGWKGFIVGGLEGDENAANAGAREILEETGYKNAKFIKNIGIVHSKFFHQVKNVNRHAHFEVAYFELQNGEQIETSEEEKKLHDVVWLNKKEVTESVNREDIKIAWDFFIKGLCYTGSGILIDSGSFSGKNSEDIKKEITDSVGGKWITKFKLRDWIFSRQRYWGEPIPVVHCEKCGIVAIPEKELPLKLPKVKNYAPTQTGESPLAAITKWVNTKCPKCKGKAKRETDTMPNWAGSSWYYLRYTDAKNNTAFASQKKLKYWTPVDWYNGGMEHTTLHLLYSRFWHKFLFDLGLVPTNEPYKKRTSHGMILAEGGEKMSKSKGNVVNPDSIVKNVGADSLRIFEMFMGPFDQSIAWDTNSIAGSRRFIERVWKIQNKIDTNTANNTDSETLVHQTIKKITEDIEAMRFNTAISAMMILLNKFESQNNVNKEQYEVLLKLLAPFAPHITEEIWANLGYKKSIHETEWPKFDTSKLVESNVTIAVQINGKLRATIIAGKDENEAVIKEKVLANEDVKKWIDNKEIIKFINIPNKLVNIVVKQ